MFQNQSVLEYFLFKINMIKNKLNIFRYWLVGAVLAVLGACSSQYRTVSKGNSKKIYNIKYGDHPRNVMDVFIPSHSNTDSPVVFMVHGGGWTIGRKEHMWNVRNALFKEDLPVVSINYRLVKKGITYKDQLADIDSAVRFFKENSKKWNLNPDNLVLLGESAGAHLVLLYGYSHPQLIKKIVSMSAPTDFYSENYMKSPYRWYTHRTFEKVVGEKYIPENIEKFKQASPIANISPVPTLLIQGDRDFLVYKKQGFDLDSVLTAKGYPHELVVMKNLGHVPRITNPKKFKSLVLPAMLKFIKE